AAKNIHKQFDRMVRLAEEDEEALKGLQQGKFQSTKLSPYLERKVNEALHKLSGGKVTLEELRNADGLQLFEYGYVWERAPDQCNQINRQVFLQGKDLQRVIQTLRLLYGKGKDEPTLDELYREVIRAQSGDREPLKPEAIRSLSLREV